MRALSTITRDHGIGVGSPLDHLLAERGYQRVEQDGDPTRPDKGYWSGDVNGLMVQRAIWWRDTHPAWQTGGETLRKFLLDRRDEFAHGVMLILHSHGGPGEPLGASN